jgi:hypothetical protein
MFVVYLMMQSATQTRQCGVVLRYYENVWLQELEGHKKPYSG